LINTVPFYSRSLLYICSLICASTNVIHDCVTKISMHQQLVTTQKSDTYNWALFISVLLHRTFTDKLSNHFASQPKSKGKERKKERKKVFIIYIYSYLTYDSFWLNHFLFNLEIFQQVDTDFPLAANEFAPLFFFFFFFGVLQKNAIRNICISVYGSWRLAACVLSKQSVCQIKTKCRDCFSF
jgi:hypothetical protein